MGVIKNLMVRIGADIRGFHRGMKDAADATASTSQAVDRHTSSMKKKVHDSFNSSKMSVKEHIETVARTKEDYQVATQNAERLSDKVEELRNVYDTVKNATQGLDLSKPLTEQITEAEEALVKIEAKRKKIEAELGGIYDSPKGRNSKRYTALQTELKSLAEKSRILEMRLANLNSVAAALGSSNMGHASAAGMKNLEAEIRATENELNTTRIRTQELAERMQSLRVGPTAIRMIRNIGSAAMQAAAGGVKKLWSGLKSLAGSAVQGIASLPAKLLKIGNSASSSCGGLSRMVRSIRNIGIVSLGMRVAGGMFGRLRSIISSYIYTNESLSASVTSLRNQMGEALAPAINLVLVAMQNLMPVVTAVSNAINSVFSALFGNAKATTAAIKSTSAAAGAAADSLSVYGFDQITKASDTSGGGGSGSAVVSQANQQMRMLQGITDWVTRLKAAFLNGNWGQIGQMFGDLLKDALTAGTSWLRNTDWLQLGKNVTNLIAGVDWNGVVSGLFRFLGSALGAGVGLLWGAIGDTVKSIGDYFTEKIEEAGGNVALGLLNGILEGLGNLGKWLTDNVITPFMAGITGLHNSVVAGIEDMINTVIGGINTLLRGLNQFLSLGEAVGLNLAIPTIPKVSLPRAARGTIVRGATDLTVGEDGTEAVVPLERHTEWLDVLASKLVTKISGNGGSGAPVVLQFFLGNRKITEYTIKDINQITRENGACPIHL